MINKVPYSLVPESFILSYRKTMHTWDWYELTEEIPITDFNYENPVIQTSVVAVQNHQQNIFVRNLYTSAKFRRMGYGSKLIRYVQGKYDLLSLDCESYLVEFYKKLDFKVIKNRKIGNRQYIRMTYSK